MHTRIIKNYELKEWSRDQSSQQKVRKQELRVNPSKNL